MVSSKTLHFVKCAFDELPAFAKVFAEHRICIDLDERRLGERVSESDAELLSEGTTECTFTASRWPMQEADLVPVERCKIESWLAHHTDHAHEVAEKAGW